MRIKLVIVHIIQECARPASTRLHEHQANAGMRQHLQTPARKMVARLQPQQAVPCCASASRMYDSQTRAPAHDLYVGRAFCKERRRARSKRAAPLLESSWPVLAKCAQMVYFLLAKTCSHYNMYSVLIIVQTAYLKNFYNV